MTTDLRALFDAHFDDIRHAAAAQGGEDRAGELAIEAFADLDGRGDLANQPVEFLHQAVSERAHRRRGRRSAAVPAQSQRDPALGEPDRAQAWRLIQRQIAQRQRRRHRRVDAAIVTGVIALLTVTGVAVHRMADTDADTDGPVLASGTSMAFDFEDAPEDGSSGPADFLTAGAHAGFEVARVDDRAHGGRWATRIALVTEQGLNGFGTVTKCMSAESFRNTRVRYSGFVASEDVRADVAGLWLRVDDAAAVPLAFDNMRDRGMEGDSDFRELEIVLDVDGEAAEMCFGALLGGTGTIWVDDLELTSVAAAGQGPPTTERDTTEFVNLGFDDGLWPGGVPAGWQVYGEPAYQVSVNNDETRGSGSVAELRHLADVRDDQAGTLSQCVDDPSELIGRTLLLTGWLKTIGVTDGTAVLYLGLVAGPDTVAEQELPDGGMAGSTEWQQLEIRQLVPDGTTSVCISVYFTGRGTVLADDLQLRVEG